MKLIDSNLIIYFARPGFDWLHTHILSLDAHFCVLSKIEVLGYAQLRPPEKAFFETYFDSITAIFPDENIVNTAIKLRQNRKMSLGDSVIAATALSYDLELYTHNVSDFLNIEGLKIFDPIPPTK